MKKSNKIISALLFLFCFLQPFLFADEGGFVIKDYSFQGVFKENNVMSVTEKIDVFFTEKRHGIYRTFPSEMYVTREKDNKLCNMTYANKVKKISVLNDNFDTSSENSTYVIKIGSENTTIAGPHTYIIKYDFVMPDDRLDNGDFFYYSVLGQYWDTTIEHFSYSIKFEKPLPQNTKMELYSGYEGNSENSLNVTLNWKNSDYIFGEAYNINPNEAITLFTNLPEGYIQGAEKTSPVIPWICAIFAILSCLFTIFKIFTTKHTKPVPTVEFYPPEDITSAEVGYIIDSSADTSDLISLLPYWAQKGYIKITEETKEVFKIKNTYLVLEKIKPLPDDAPVYMQTLFNEFFSYGDKFELQNIPSSFATTMSSAKKELEEKFTGEKALYKGKTLSRSLLFISSLFTGLALLTSSAISISYNIDALISVIILFFLGILTNSYPKQINFNKKKYFSWILLSIIDIALSSMIYSANISDPIIPQSVYTILLILYNIILIFNGKIIQMTDYNLKITGKLLGFKEFIKTAEEPRLRELLSENTEYCYDVLPYAMAFDMLEKWTKQFNKLDVKQPSWYYGTNSFSVNSFAKTLNTHLSSPIEASSGSSSSSSGGSSGGGGGGGGGGSW